MRVCVFCHDVQKPPPTLGQHNCTRETFLASCVNTSKLQKTSSRVLQQDGAAAGTGGKKEAGVGHGGENFVEEKQKGASKKRRLRQAESLVNEAKREEERETAPHLDRPPPILIDRPPS